MTKIKRLPSDADTVVDVLSPVSQEEILDRIQNYSLMDPKKFAKIYHSSRLPPHEFYLER